MQPTLNTITTAIASHLDRELDEPFKRLLATKIDNWRSTLIGRSLEKTAAQRRLFTQPCMVPMENVKMTDNGPCLFTIARSVNIIPKPMRIGTILFDYVGAVDGNTPFGNTVPGTQGYLRQGKYSGKQVFYEYVNGKLEIQQNKAIPLVKINAVWDNPTEVFEFNGGSDFWNEPYPATNDMIQMITQYILQVDYNRPVVPPSGDIKVDEPLKTVEHA